ncbi:hypothetical protein, partial [Aeromonas caviae]|uniref:hypothetical protein n=1 Tax=Aeromonas caviae TaxID=648 RepID=UPI001FC89DEA
HLGRCATPVGGGHGRSRPDALGGLAIDRPGPNTGCGVLGQCGHSSHAVNRGAGRCRPRGICPGPGAAA